MAAIENVSKAEAIKQQSRQLRGNLARDLADTAAPFDNAGYSLLKFHGIYQGYDRDSATERKQRGDEKLWQFMVRVRIPGGRLTADQYLALDSLSDRYANGSLRVTTRQSIQFHGVVKPGLKTTIAEINHALLTTLAACGDVVRTVTTVPAPICDAVHRRLEDDARRLSTHLLPRTGAYHEIWLDGERLTPDNEVCDPLYGERYLPRKFKIGLAIPDDNTIDVLTNDLAIVALFDGEKLAGYNFLLGGGHGMTHNKPETYPRLATPVAFVEPDDLLEAAAAVVRLHRDWGDRGNRRHARLKYVIAERGDDWARDRLSEDLGKKLMPCRAMPEFRVPDHLGWHEQGDGSLYLGVPVASGRIVDDGRVLLRSALRRRRRPLPVQPNPDAEPGHHSERDRSDRPRRNHSSVARLWRAPRRGIIAGRALGLGLPGITELRLGADRGRAGTRGHRRRHRGAARALGPGTRAAQRPHHRLPQWLRPALQRRHWHCRPGAGVLLALCRRRFRGHSAEPGDRRTTRHRRSRRDARPAVRAVRRLA